MKHARTGFLALLSHPREAVAFLGRNVSVFLLLKFSAWISCQGAGYDRGIKVYLFLANMISQWWGAFSPQIVGIYATLILCMVILVVYLLGHGIFHPIAVLFFSKIGFGGGNVLSSQN